MLDCVGAETFPACCPNGSILFISRAVSALLCLRLLFVLLVRLPNIQYLLAKFSMGNESSLPSESTTPNSDWQSIYSNGSCRPGRRSSMGSIRIPSPVEPPQPDLSHLSPEEIAQIQAVIGRAKELREEDSKRIKKLEEEYVTYAADLERRASEAVAAAPERKDTPLCPICLKNELHIKEGRMKEGQNVCVDCGNLICLECGKMESSITTKAQEWVCNVCIKRRQLVLTSGMWHPGCNMDDDIPLAKEIQSRMEGLEKKSKERGPLVRSVSAEDSKMEPEAGASFMPKVKRQTSLPDYSFNPSFSADSQLDSITEGNHSTSASQEALAQKVSPGSDDTRSSTGGSKLKGMGQPVSRSDSEYSDITSDVDMEDESMLRYGIDVSPDDVSDDYSLMSIGSSDDSGKMRRKHRPKSLNLSRSHSATSSDDETTDSAMSTDVESKYSNVAAPDVNDIRIALAASAFVEDMRVDMSHDTDDEVAAMTSLEVMDEAKLRFSPSAPISPSWREGLESPPFSPRRRDSYPGKRRGSSPVSPKDKHFTYTDISPPSRQLSLEELYDNHAQASSAENPSLVSFAQRPSPKSPDELKDSFYSTSGEILSFHKPVTSMKKSKPFYSLDSAQDDLGDPTTVIDLATYAASVASSTANLTSLTVSPTNVVEYKDDASNRSYQDTEDYVDSQSPGSPGYYDNAPYEEGGKVSEDEEDIELADPSQKSIDYQGSKRQKARPPNTDWSPVIDLSPILDVSPSLEEAEQAEMLAQQQEERRRQESKEELDSSPEIKTFTGAAEGQAEVDYMYYGLKRYDRVEDISVLSRSNNGALSDERSNDSGGNSERKSTDSGEFDLPDSSFTCTSLSGAPNSTTTISTSQDRRDVSGGANRDIYRQPPAREAPNSRTDTKSDSNPKPNVKPESQNTPSRGKVRRKLPQPTAEILATQRSPVPKPRKRDKSNEPPPKPARSAKPEPRDTHRNQAINQSHHLSASHENILQKQDSDERRKTAKDMKARPDPVLIKHIETEEASASPQYKVLDSPPSPETKSMIRREYSDSTSVSPSSSPDRDVYLFPSPVTPPDSDSSPPKPHSPSSGTDFEEEGAFMEAAKLHTREVTHRNTSARESGTEKASKSIQDRIRLFEKEPKTQPPPPSTRPKPSAAQRESKQREMKKIRRKLPQIPSEEESPQHKAKGRGQSPRKNTARNESKPGRRKFGTPSASDDSSMNEDDYEVAHINRKKYINDLDKPSMDKQNGNYLQVTDSTASSRSSSNGYKSDEFLKANIPPDTNTAESDVATDKYRNETDLIIDSMINIYGAPITNAMKSLKKRLQEEVRRVTEGRRRRIEEFEEIRALKMQIGELKLGTDAQKKVYESRTSGKATLCVPGSNGKKRGSSNSRSSPQVLPRRARHKRQSSDPMVAKFSPIKEDKDIEAEIQGRSSEDPKGSKDDSSLSGLSDNDSIRSEPVLNSRQRRIKPSDYAKMFFSKQAQSVDRLDKRDVSSMQMISSHSEGNIPLNSDDDDFRIREEKKRELQYEIEKRKRQLADKSSPKKEPSGSSNRPQSGPKQHLAHSCDEIPRRTMVVPPYLPPRPIPTGIIKPIDDDSDVYSKDSYVEDYKPYYQNQSYSSTEYLAHKQEEMLKQRFEELGAYSSPFLYSGEVCEKSAFVPQMARTNLDTHSYSTGNVNISKDIGISGSVTLPDIHTVRSDIDLTRANAGAISDTDNSPPHEVTPAMPLLTDITARSRKIIHEIGTGSRPVSAEFNLGVEDLMNGMYRVESDNSVDADEPIMKHMMEGGVTILKQLERRKQPPPTKPKKYAFPTKRILLTSESKERTIKGPGRHGNGIGMKIVGGKQAPDTPEVGAYVAAIYKGGVAEQLHGELQEGDQILEWNGIELSGKSYEEVQQVIGQPNGEIELVVRPRFGSVKRILGDTTAQAPSCHSSYDNLDSDEDNEHRFKSHQGVDPKQLAAQLEGIQETESPSISQSSSQHDYHTPSASSACSSPRSDPISTSSDQRHRHSNTSASANTSNTNSLSVDSAEKLYVNIRLDRVERNDRFDRPERRERQYERGDSVERQDRMERQDFSETNNNRTERNERVDRFERNQGQDRTDIQEKSDRIERSERVPATNERPERDDKLNRPERPERSARADRRERQHERMAERVTMNDIQNSRIVPSPKIDRQENDIQSVYPRSDRQMGDIQIKLNHDDLDNVFNIHVIQARNLLPKDLNGLSDPFVKIYLLPGRCSENKRRTKHIARTLNPEWNETVVFPNVHQEELQNKTLEITVWDYDRFKTNDFLGEVVLDLSANAFLDNIPHWYPLCEHDDSRGMELPRPTVLPPRGGGSSPSLKRPEHSPRAKSKDRLDKNIQSGGHRDERIWHGLGRRRRSLGTLADVDKV